MIGYGYPAGPRKKKIASEGCGDPHADISCLFLLVKTYFPTRGENTAKRLQYFCLEFRLLWEGPNCRDQE